MYQHLTDFSEFTGFRILSILTMANGLGAGAGAVVAYLIAGRIPLPGFMVWAICIGIGLAVTWPHETVPLGRLGTLWLRYQIRRLIAPTTLEIDSRSYYPHRVTGPKIVAAGKTVSYNARRTRLTPVKGERNV